MRGCIEAGMAVIDVIDAVEGMLANLDGREGEGVRERWTDVQFSVGLFSVGRRSMI
jgi:hypothetical protein